MPDRPATRLAVQVKRDHLIGLIYLIVVPTMIGMILLLGLFEHRSSNRRAAQIAARAEASALHSCRTSEILRDVIAAVLPPKNAPNLTAAQKRMFNKLRHAVDLLGPLSCKPPGGSS